MALGLFPPIWAGSHITRTSPLNMDSHNILWSHKFSGPYVPSLSAECIHWFFFLNNQMIHQTRRTPGILLKALGAFPLLSGFAVTSLFLSETWHRCLRGQIGHTWEQGGLYFLEGKEETSQLLALGFRKDPDLQLPQNCLPALRAKRSLCLRQTNPCRLE